MTCLFDPSLINKSDNKLQEIAKTYYENYNKSIHSYQIDNLIELTKKQNQSRVWNLYRAGRITASISKLAFSSKIGQTSKDQKISQTFINTCMHYKENVSVSATKYGNKSEHKAREVLQIGLHVKELHPFLAASLDGLVECKCHEKCFLEIKCPYKFQNTLDG